MERIDKLLASTGRWSRREVKLLIKEGRVLLDGLPAASPDQKIDPEASRLQVDGAELTITKYTYLMMNKPAGILSATEDARQKTILDLLPPDLQKQNLFPVGRLDKDTTGLVLLTNNGSLAHRLLSPKKHVDKTYYIRTEDPLSLDDCTAFAQGITLSDGTACLPAKLDLLDGGCEALVTLHEGKFHQIKRMIACRGTAVCQLKRLSIGTLVLDQSLKEGEFRTLTKEEVSNLGGNT